ncbi:MAG: carboxypeptidase-like regulatory domain-containing protein [Desulfuromonadales bacterium]|nr:carboxypeptidase-like regulatory domain-containing protein [Desulfuromonadales bacterium]
MSRANVHGILWLVLGCALVLLTACQSLTGAGTVDQIASEQQPLVVNLSIDGGGKTGIQGQVTVKGASAPLSGAYVNIYQNTMSNLLGPSQFISLPTDAEGRYRLEIPPGTYFVVARKRMSGQPTGPLAPGDFYSEHQRIVTRVEAGRIAVVDLEVAPIKAPMFFKSQVVDRETTTGIRGLLVDQAGKPVMGGFAMAYADPAMQRHPDFASTLSDEQGHFTLYLPEGGTYYLAARIHAWDMPTPGEPYGKYGGETAAAVSVPSNQFVEGINIEMAPFAGPYQEGKSRRPF